MTQKYLLTTIVIISMSIKIHANTFTVTNTNDSGTGSIREAIDYANVLTGPHTIAFNIPVSDPNYNISTGVWTINLITTLNYIIKDNITIDGTTQTTNQGDTNPLGPEIELDGNNNAVDYAFSIINSSNIHIKGLCIKQFILGIQIFGTSSANNTIKGNYIGINATSADTAGNYIGIEIIGGAHDNIIGGSNVNDRNVVSGNEHIGIRIVDASNNTVIGNYVGTDRMGISAMGNYDGVSIEGAATYNTVGGINSGDRNIISGNYAYGVPVFGAGCNYNEIFGNYIGTDETGTYAIPNTYGVLFDDGAAFNVLGGDDPVHRNLLSGNSGYGVFIYNLGTHENIVKGNFIGTNSYGAYAIPNANGIVVDGAAINHTIDNNLISGNLQQGIVIHITGCNGHVITRNKIGTDCFGTASLGNGIDGIRIGEGPQSNIIGGSPANGNIIAYNQGNGVTIMNDNDDFNLISCNSIFSNNGLGIDLYLPGVNVNDSGDGDIGPNQGMNYPEIDTVIYYSGTGETVVSGKLDTQNPENCTIEIFRAIPDPTGFGEGAEYYASATPDGFGNWSDTIPGISEGTFITTTATDSYNNTSEFSLTASSLYAVSVDRKDNNKNILIYPNPGNGIFNISVEFEYCEVADSQGKTVRSISFGSKNSSNVIDMRNEKRGLYFIKVFNKSGWKSDILILQ
ncbi:MAG: T9SS type A sorting domain-containing protein [Bacteroidota bacterium]